MSKRSELPRSPRPDLLPAGAFFGETLRTARLEDFVVTEVQTPAGVNTAFHAHERAYFELVLEGRWFEQCGRQERTLEPWLVIYHPPGERHRNRFPGLPGRSLHVEISDAWVRQLGTHDFAADRSLESRTREVVTPLLRLVREVRKPDRWSPLSVAGSVMEVASLLGRDSGRQRTTAIAPWVERLEEILRSEYAGVFSLAEVAHRLGVRPFALTRGFRQRYGCVPSEYLRRLRVEHAARALRSGHHPLSVIAASSGFADQSHMTRVFRAYTGQTPGAFRRHEHRDTRNETSAWLPASLRE